MSRWSPCPVPVLTPGGVLSVSCHSAKRAILAVSAQCEINNLRVINMALWFKSTPRNHPAAKGPISPEEHSHLLRCDRLRLQCDRLRLQCLHLTPALPRDRGPNRRRLHCRYLCPRPSQDHSKAAREPKRADPRPNRFVVGGVPEEL